MAKDKKEIKFRNFIGRLTDEECRSELLAAYLQMERCQQALRGEDVEPVEMMDNGESSDLELFYQCKKTASELEYLNGVISGKHEEDE
jgi:hypothetical protein